MTRAGRHGQSQARNRTRTAAALDDGRPAEKSCRTQIAAGARKCNHNFSTNARPYKKRKDQPSGHGTGSPRGTLRAGWRRQSGARNGTKTTAAPREEIFYRTHSRRNSEVQTSRSQHSSGQATNPETSMQQATRAGIRTPPVLSIFAADTSHLHARTLRPMT